ncbi:DUF2357 domain-containing protein [Paenibacillus sp. UNC451MF]|uniref:DUF2357 domain-containing protein n=1 Tax=Paenibacillus sp. UNC451MF TaxID=1449063 RepID=UPI00048EFC40|nr:DUF2357 domain-containing protein [Paenibacillus sp. UNC451MF]
METVEVTEVIFEDESKRASGKMVIYAERKNSLFVLNQSEERLYNEERVQLVENGVYEYELLDVRIGIKIRGNSVIIPSKITGSIQKGRIETGSYNGLFPLLLEDGHGKVVGRTSVEIKSTKINYREDYRSMLQYIGDKCNDLLLDIKSPTQLKLATDPSKDPDTIQQRFAFLKSIIESREFKDAIRRIISTGHTSMIDERINQDIRKNVRHTSDSIKQIARNPKRMPVPTSHGLHGVLYSKGVSTPSIPTFVTVNEKIEVNDTPENRFIKYSLQVYSDFLSKIEKVLSTKKRMADKRLLSEVKSLNEYLYETLSADFFRGLQEPTYIPYGSTVLQRKAGYRELMQAWIRFQLATKLIWEGGEDVFNSGKRDLPLLYEYWLFFQLLSLVSKKFKLSEPPVNRLIEVSADGLYMKLKSGKQLVIDGLWDNKGRKLRVQFSYNKTFKWTPNRSEQGSWTQQMRPDYTLSFWPAEFSMIDAEKQELMVHIHFDAKYKVDNIEGLFGRSDENLDDEKERQREGIYKRADLLKMHSYRDAINRSEGAYVLYPGTQDKTWQGYHEILPGVGAFAISPGKTGEASGLTGLSEFLTKVVDHLCNRSTMRERYSYYNYLVHKEQSEGAVFANVPERRLISGEREKPVDDIKIILALVKNQEIFDWVQSTGKVVSNLELVDDELIINPVLFSAESIILIGAWDKRTLGIYKINSSPHISSLDRIKSLNYPNIERDFMHVVFNIEVDTRYDGIAWDFSDLNQLISVNTLDEVVKKYSS